MPDYCMSGTAQLWQDGNVPHKKSRKKFRAVEAVKALARERIGSPPTSKVVPNRKKKAERYKPTLEKLLGEAE